MDRDRQEPLWFGVDATGSMEGTIFAEERFDIALLEEIKSEFGGAIPPEKLAAFIRKKQSQTMQTSIRKETVEPTRSEQIKNLKSENSRWAKRIAYRHGMEPREVNNTLNIKVGIDSVNGDEATLSKLEARLRMALEVYETGRWS